MNGVQFSDGDFQNRNRIMTRNGVIWLTVPILKPGTQLIKDVKINNTVNWRKKHWDSISQAYSKTPYFHDYADMFESVYKKEWDRLETLNTHLLILLLKILGIKTQVVLQSDYPYKGTKNDLLIDMCKICACDTFMFGSQGIDYADIDSFKLNNIKPIFQDYVHPVYKAERFALYVSVIDLLFNCGGNSYDIIMSGGNYYEM